MEQNSGCMSYTKSSPWYTETFRTVGVPPKKKTHIITYSVASVPQNHNINMAGGSLRQIRVKVSIIQHRYEGTRAPYSCMFIHVYIRNRTRPNNISEAVEPAQKSILLSKLKYFPNNYSEKKIYFSFQHSPHHERLPFRYSFIDTPFCFHDTSTIICLQLTILTFILC